MRHRQSITHRRWPGSSLLTSVATLLTMGSASILLAHGPMPSGGNGPPSAPMMPPDISIPTGPGDNSGGGVPNGPGIVPYPPSGPDRTSRLIDQIRHLGAGNPASEQQGQGGEVGTADSWTGSTTEQGDTAGSDTGDTHGPPEPASMSTPIARVKRDLAQLENDISHLRDDLAALSGGSGGEAIGKFGGGPFGGGLGQGGLGQPGGNPFGGGPFGGGFGQGGLGQPTDSHWTVTNTGNGSDHIDLGKYTLDLNKSNMQWTLKNKETGAETAISGE